MEQEIIEFMFNALNQIKLFHWATKSFAAHNALDSLHGTLSTHVDTLVETYIGTFARQPLGVFQVNTVCHSDTSEIIPYLRNLYAALKKLRKKFNQTELQNIMDEISTAVTQALYLLNLS